MFSLISKLRERKSLLTARETAELLGQSSDAGYVFLRRHPELRIRVGGRLRVDPFQLADYLERPSYETIRSLVEEM
jgi:hypothetical protein